MVWYCWLSTKPIVIKLHMLAFHLCFTLKEVGMEGGKGTSFKEALIRTFIAWDFLVVLRLSISRIA
nr:hypothetical protein Q903MT_gene1034 [Picea sitchensis]